MNTIPNNNKTIFNSITQKITSAATIAALTASSFVAQAQDMCSNLISVHSFNNTVTNENSTAAFSGIASYGIGASNQAITTSTTTRTATIPNLPVGNSVRTVALWFKDIGSTGYVNIFHYGANAAAQRFGAYHNTTTGELVFQGFGTGNDEVINNATITANTWHHLVVIYTGFNVQVYLNGVLKESFAKTLNTGTALPFTIGGFDGYLDDLRIYNRVLTATDISSLYNNPGYDCFSIMGDRCTDLVSSYFFNNSSTNQNNTEAFSGAASYATGVAGTGIVSSATTNTATITGLPVGSSTRTVALWFKDISSTGAVNIFHYGNNAAAQRFGAYHNTTTGELVFQGFGTGNDEVINNATIATNTWYHLAVTYTGTHVEVYLDGVLKESFSRTLNTGTAIPFTIGGFNGYFDDLRVYDTRLGAVDIAHLYNNPESICVVAPSNATELFHFQFDGQSLVSSINATDELVANQGTTQYTTSTSAEGGTHALSTDGNQHFSMPFTMPATGGFTISMWVNRPTASNDYDVLAAHLKRDNSTYPGTFLVGLNPSGQPFMETYVSPTYAPSITASSILPNATWQHLTFKWKQGTPSKSYIYINGVLSDSAVTASSLNTSVVGIPFSIGSLSNVVGGTPGLQSSYEGHIDEVRLFDGALTSPEVMDLFNNILNVNTVEDQKTVAVVFPNPAKTILNVLLNTQGETTIEIYDLAGKQVKTAIVYDAQTQLNVEDLNAGIYLLKITNGNETATSKFIKE